MKKVITVIAVCSIILLSLYANIGINNTNGEILNITIENIEALANSEGSGNIHCAYKGSIDCPIFGDKVKSVW